MPPALRVVVQSSREVSHVVSSCRRARRGLCGRCRAVDGATLQSPHIAEGGAASAVLPSAARRGRVTLVYTSHDTQHNNAVALQEFLRKKVRRSASKRTSAASRPRSSPR